MKYSAAVRRHFQQPSHAGAPANPSPEWVRGEAGSHEAIAWVVFWARIVDGRIAGIAFEALACPHVIAACSRISELLAGQTPEFARAFDPLAMMAELEIPAGKRGRLLIVEDALRNCLAAWDTTQLAGA